MLRALILLALLAPPAALAATFTVTKSADTADGACDADCSLREAVIAANAAPGADAILVPAGTYTLTIPGPDPSDNDAASAGDPTVGDLDVTGPTAIVGLGAAPGDTVVDANGAATNDRAFHSLAILQRVELRNLTIQGGKAAGRRGGGVYGFRSNLVLDACVVRGNTALFGAGVALQTTGGESGKATLDIRNSDVSDNAVAGANGIGGGVFAGPGATTTVSNTTISGNSGAALGGGLGMAGGAHLLAVGSFFTGNAATVRGGGVQAGGLGATLRRCVVSENTAMNGGGIGGDADAALEASAVRNNTASQTGGGYASNGGDLDAADTTFEGNAATGNVGGAISGGKVKLRRCTIAGNSAKFSGGGLYLTGGSAQAPTVDIENATITGNQASEVNGNNGVKGAGLVMSHFNARTLKLVNATVADNVSGGQGEQLSCNGCADGWTLRNVVVSGSGSNCHWGTPTDPAPVSEGGNLDSGSGCGFAAPSDVPNADAKLAALAANGGPTKTRALQAGSDALGAGATCPANDQRGFLRNPNVCDSGAYEAYTPASADAFSCGGDYAGVRTQLDYVVEDVLPDAAADVGDVVRCFVGLLAG